MNPSSQVTTPKSWGWSVRWIPMTGPSMAAIAAMSSEPTIMSPFISRNGPETRPAQTRTASPVPSCCRWATYRMRQPNAPPSPKCSRISRSP